MGTDPNTKEDVAIKLIPLNFRQVRVESIKKDFYREIRIARKLNHPNIIRIYDYGEEELGLYAAMEYAKHGDLAGLLKKKGKLELSQAINVLRVLPPHW